ncbi:headcase protein [Anastrepha ludens]|uniref:headcase protein n=1 Tax=Anastrepha ludens TaxID=28586 RepID=UPI0023B10E2B|nr:headcase protein [Anastrepha ludens]XP_053947422.1 headcase protein [Anastrepha ludens]
MLLMAPRRDSNSANSNSSILIQHQIQHQQQQQTQQVQQQPHAFLYSSSLFSRATLLEPTNGTTAITNSSNDSLITNSSNLNNSNNNTIIMPPMQTGNLAHATLNGAASGGSTSVTQNGHHQHHVGNISNNNNINNNINGNSNINIQDQFTRCCYPNGECLKLDASLIVLDDLSDVVRVLCNNENCNMGQYMHRECFDAWEQSVLATLKSMGRARTWSDRQRSQNLWTKKGYDLVYKACVCKCGHGHIRKDLDWTPPVQIAGAKSSSTINGGQYGNVNGGLVAGGVNQQRLLVVNGANGNGIGGSTAEEDDKKKKKKRNRNNNGTKPTLVSVNSNSHAANGQQQGQMPQSPVQAQQTLQQQPSEVAQQQSANVLLNGQQSSGSNISNGISAICTPNNTNKTAGNAIIANNPNNTLICSSNNNNQLSAITNSSVGVIGSGLHNSSNTSNQQQPQQVQGQQQQQQQGVTSLNNILGVDLRDRAGSLSSSGGGSGSTSPSASHSSGDISISPIHHNPQQQHQQQQHQMQLQQYQQSLLQQNGLSKSILNGALNGCVDTIQRNAALLAAQQQPTGTPIVGGIGAANGLNGIKQLSIYDQHLVQQQKNKEVELYSERVRLTSGCNGIFSRRLDFSSFNLLPKTRLNSYQVKVSENKNDQILLMQS